MLHNSPPFHFQFILFVVLIWSNPTEEQAKFKILPSFWFLNNHNHCLISLSCLFIRLKKQSCLLKYNSINLPLWLLLLFTTKSTSIVLLRDRSAYIHCSHCQFEFTCHWLKSEYKVLGGKLQGESIRKPTPLLSYIPKQFKFGF